MIWADVLIVIHSLVLVGLSFRVIMKKTQISSTYTWILLFIFLPYGGFILYLLIGELSLGKKKIERAEKAFLPIRTHISSLFEKFPFKDAQRPPREIAIHRLAKAVKGVSAVIGNKVDLFSDYHQMFDSIVSDIDKSKHHCHLLFYIWEEGGYVNDVCEALIRAAERGVTCKVLIDHVGSSNFRSSSLRRKMKKAGVSIHTSLKVNFIRMWFQRIDLRNHRKIIVIDNQIAYTGSQNMVDPRYFKASEKVGLWIDILTRIEGPAVELLNLVFLWDWTVDTDEALEDLIESLHLTPSQIKGTETLQIIPSSPGVGESSVHEILMAMIYSAKESIILTTPYFVPTEAMVNALKTKALSGVEVTMIVPQILDSVMVRFASKSLFEELLECGVKIARYKKGLLHSKIITIDHTLAFMGSHNLDMRSFYINFEVSLLAYSQDFTSRLVDLQNQYLKDSEFLQLELWQKRPLTVKVLESTVRLLSPLL